MLYLLDLFPEGVVYDPDIPVQSKIGAAEVRGT